MNRRNEGIDLLRCVSMLMIVVLHVLNHGGILAVCTPGSTLYNAAWLLEFTSGCAVNCYALISGYVGVTARHRYRNIIALWLQVAFYAVLIALLLPLFISGAEQRPLIAAFLPVIHRYYWYFTAYFALFFLMPLMNKGIGAMTASEAKKLLTGLFAVFSGMSVLPYINVLDAVRMEDVFLLGEGYSVIWLLMMYIAGGCIRRHGFGESVRAWKLWTGFGLSVLAGWCFKLLVEQDAPEKIRALVEENALFYYFSPTMVIAAVCLLLIFSRASKLPVLPGKIVRLLAPAAFSVYLIHEHPQVRAGLISGRFARYAAGNPLGMIAKVLFAALAIFAVCCMIDQLRLLLFRALRIRQALDWIADRGHAED